LRKNVPEQVRCPECGYEHAVYVMLSTPSGSVPAFIERDYARCPWCGYGTLPEADSSMLNR
jgi:DNA-directed RNA polymerase subunit RPC12/RpoP